MVVRIAERRFDWFDRTVKAVQDITLQFRARLCREFDVATYGVTDESCGGNIRAAPVPRPCTLRWMLSCVPPRGVFGPPAITMEPSGLQSST
jgi:hypothetical protein